MGAQVVLERISNMTHVTRTPAQLLACGRNGPVGDGAPCHVVEDNTQGVEKWRSRRAMAGRNAPGVLQKAGGNFHMFRINHLAAESVKAICVLQDRRDSSGFQWWTIGHNHNRTNAFTKKAAHCSRLGIKYCFMCL